MIRIEQLNLSLNNGIFAKLNAFDVPWESTLSIYLDLEYLYNFSGKKICSPMVEKMAEATGTLSDAQLVQLAHICFLHFGTKWNKLWAMMNETEYDPIENYNRTEVETPDITRTNDGTSSSSVNAVTQSDVYGYNVETPTHDSKATSTASPEDNYVTNVSTETETGTRTTNIHGNIGVTTTQQMMEQEITAREFDLIQKVYEDIDKVLTINIY